MNKKRGEASKYNREFKRGEAPNTLQGVRGTKSLSYKQFPFPLTRGRGKRGWGHLILRG